MKTNIFSSLAFLILTGCSDDSNQKQRLNSEVAALELERAKKQEIYDNIENNLNVSDLKNLILASDSVYLLIGEDSPHKVPLPVSEKLTKRKDIERLVNFIPNDTSTLPLITNHNSSVIPPPIKFGKPIGALKIYTNSFKTVWINTVWIDIYIDSTGTYFYTVASMKKKSFTKEGHAYFKEKFKEYKSF
ncbi:hypothetical protein [Pontibacter fetidus]|uniref:Lipoprotein n=1 Tax=Pontibacter fetidus TaxID=2700082 RepID=A0A6B2HAH0_9BACT|nr:hypothetical protein [Pontibacter fetidus]NDK57320.1 hypothetical protein [Pontibacter fetidus]